MKKALKNNKYKSELILIFATMLWGGTFAVVKQALESSSPMMFIGWRFFLAFVLLIPFIFKFKREFTKKAVLAGGLLGLFYFLGFATQTVGLKYTLATKSAFITAISVVLVPLMQTTIEKRPPTKGALIGTGLVLIGVLFLSSGGNSVLAFLSDLGKNFNYGDFLTLLCAIFFAAYIVYLDISSSKHGFWVILVMQIAVTAFLSFFAAFVFDSWGIEQIKFEITKNTVFGLLYTTLFTTLLTTVILTKYQKNITPTKAALIYSLEPLFASIFAFFLLGETLTFFAIIGAAFILSGLIIAETYDSQKNKA